MTKNQVPRTKNRVTLIKIIDPWCKLLSAIATLAFAGLAAFGVNPIENLLWAILVYHWGRDG